MLTVCQLLTLALLGISLGTYVESRPNTGVSSVGPFDSKRTLNQVRALILVDMIADAHLDIHREAHSTPWLIDVVFSEAQRLGYGRYFLNSPTAIEDDHTLFLELGVPTVDIIDLDYGPFNLYWHSRYDTVDECSPTSLAIVARVVLATLAALESNLPSQPRGASS